METLKVQKAGFLSSCYIGSNKLLKRIKYMKKRRFWTLGANVEPKR